QDRKLRLLACASVRRLWDILPEQGRQAVEVAEQFADGAAVSQELARAYDAGSRAWEATRMGWSSMISSGMAVAIEEASSAALYATTFAPEARYPAGTPGRKAAKADERRAQLALFRCI